MAEQLTTPRILFDAQTQSAQHIYRHDPFVVDMGYKIVQPLGFNLRVKDSGMFIFREGERRVRAHVLYDEYGRPLTEDVENNDLEEITARQWYWQDGEFGFDSTFDNGADTLADQYCQQLDEDTFQYNKDGKVFTLRREMNGNNTEWVVYGENEAELERTVYGSDGKLLWVRNVYATTTFHYDQLGRLIREEKTPGSMEVNSEPTQDITEYDYRGTSTVKVLGLTGVEKGSHYKDTIKLEQLRKYDSERRPVEISSREGVFDMGQVALDITVEYPALLSSEAQ